MRSWGSLGGWWESGCELSLGASSLYGMELSHTASKLPVSMAGVTSGITQLRSMLRSAPEHSSHRLEERLAGPSQPSYKVD